MIASPVFCRFATYSRIRFDKIMGIYTNTAQFYTLTIPDIIHEVTVFRFNTLTDK